MHVIASEFPYIVTHSDAECKTKKYSWACLGCAYFCEGSAHEEYHSIKRAAFFLFNDYVLLRYLSCLIFGSRMLFSTVL